MSTIRATCCNIRWLWILSIAVSCGSPTRTAPRPEVTRVYQSKGSASSICRAPKQVAVVQIAIDDSDASRLLIASVATGAPMWVGPPGSGAVKAVWSENGATLAYAVGSDIVVHSDSTADRLVFRRDAKHAGTEFHPELAFSPNGKYLAIGTAPMAIVEVGQSGNLSSKTTTTTIECDVTGLFWNSDSSRIIARCDAGELLRVWEVASGSAETVGLAAETDRVLNWHDRAKGEFIALREDDDLWIESLSLGESGESGESGGSSSTQSRRFASEPSDVGVVSVVGFVPAAKIAVLSDYQEDEGYPRTLWLLRSGAMPPLAWIDGAIFEPSFSRDGAWAVFASSADMTSESGDIYLARVAHGGVRTILRAPLDDIHDVDGEVAVDSEDPDEEEREPSYGSYKRPLLRPEPGSCSALLPRKGAVLHQNAIGGGPATNAAPKGMTRLFRGGAVLSFVPAGPGTPAHARWRSRTGIRDIAPASGDTFGAALGLAGGGVVLAGSTYSLWLDASGRELARLPSLDLSESEISSGTSSTVTPLGTGGLALVDGTSSIELYDATGRNAGRFNVAPDAIVGVVDRSAGVAVQTSSGSIVLLDTGARVVGRYALLPDSAWTVLRGGALATVRNVEASDEEATRANDYDRLLQLEIRGADGTVRGRRRFLAADGEVVAVLALPNGGVAVVAGAERTKLLLFDGSARQVGMFRMGVKGIAPPLVRSDGTLLVISGERSIFHVDGRGRFLAGALTHAPIDVGPFPWFNDRVVLQTADGVVTLDGFAK